MVAQSLPAIGTDSATKASPLEMDRLGLLVMVRLGGQSGATKTELIRDLGPIISHRLSQRQWREVGDAMLIALCQNGFADKRGQRFVLSATGREAADGFLGRTGESLKPWNEIRHGRLMAAAIGLKSPGPQRLAAIETAEGLRALLILLHFGLPTRPVPTPAKLRTALAGIALKQAFGTSLNGGIGDGSGLSAHAGRELAAQLLDKPRSYPSDTKLIASLAAQIAGTRQDDLESLRTAILRRFVEPRKAVATGPTSTDRARPAGPGRDAGPAMAGVAPSGNEEVQGAGTVTAGANRPSLNDFAQVVQRAAASCAEGWPGNYKAYISRVWPALKALRPDWDLSEIEYKCLLAEAHLTGLIELAGVDLKASADAGELQASEITYKNTTWHQIRLAATS